MERIRLEENSFASFWKMESAVAVHLGAYADGKRARTIW
jgi:hypothetical protein